MDLYIVRHAWAADRDDPRWPDDDLRPLTDEGKERFAQMAAKLVERGVTPGIIATSPLVRCVETAEILAAGVPERPEIVEFDELRPGSDLDALWRWTVHKARKHEQIAWVGHVPDVCLAGRRADRQRRRDASFCEGGRGRDPVSTVRRNLAAGELQMAGHGEIAGLLRPPC